MAVNAPTDLALAQDLTRLARQLDKTGHGDKGTMKRAFCDLHGWSLQKLHQELKRIGWRSGRKRREDAGSTCQDEAAITELGSALRQGVRKNGKATMEIPNARSILAANGRDFKVSNGRLGTLLRQRRLDARTQREPTAHTTLRSLHPNHVHQVDPSLCLLYYTPGGEQRLIRDDEAYKNKPEFIERIGELKCWRYVLVDHYSNVTLVRYYQAKGETQANLYDFLLWCWGRLEGRPFHGVPMLLVWDKGSANTSSAIRIALKALNVETYEHQAGNARAKGAVEEGNNRVEKLFESRLKYEPVHSVAELNAAAEAWCNAYNADAIPHYDARLRRRGMARHLARYDVWQHIRQEQLRLLPDPEVCRYLLSAEPKPRKVRPDLTVSFVHPQIGESRSWDVRGVEGVYPRLEVMVSPLVMGDRPRLIVAVEDYKGDITEHLVEPVRCDPLSGQRLDSPVWGEAFDRPPDTVADRAGKAADRAAYPDLRDEEIKKARDKNAAPFGGLDAHSHLGEVYVPDYLDKRGTELHVPDRARVEVKPLSQIEAAKLLRARMGEEWKPEYFARLGEWYPQGVPEAELAAVEARLLGDAQAQRAGLSVVK